MNQDHKVDHRGDRREGHAIATYAVELIDHGTEPDWTQPAPVQLCAGNGSSPATPPAMSSPRSRIQECRMLASTRRRASQRDALNQMTPVDHGVTLTRRSARGPDRRQGHPQARDTPSQSRIDQRASGARPAALRAAIPPPRRRRPQDSPAGPHRPRPPGPQPAAMSPRPRMSPLPPRPSPRSSGAHRYGSRPGSTTPPHVHANENYWRSSVKLDRIAVMTS